MSAHSSTLGSLECRSMLRGLACPYCHCPIRWPVERPARRGSHRRNWPSMEHRRPKTTVLICKHVLVLPFRYYSYLFKTTPAMKAVNDELLEHGPGVESRAQCTCGLACRAPHIAQWALFCALPCALRRRAAHEPSSSCGPSRNLLSSYHAGSWSVSALLRTHVPPSSTLQECPCPRDVIRSTTG